MGAIGTSATGQRDRLIQLRKNAGKTQREVAADLDISETYLRLLEKGSATPSVDLLFRMARYYDSDVYDCWSDLSGSKSPKSAVASPK